MTRVRSSVYEKPKTSTPVVTDSDVLMELDSDEEGDRILSMLETTIGGDGEVELAPSR